MEVLKGETNKLRRSDDDDDDDDRAHLLVLVLVGRRGCGMKTPSGDETVRRVISGLLSSSWVGLRVRVRAPTTGGKET